MLPAASDDIIRIVRTHNAGHCTLTTGHLRRHDNGSRRLISAVTATSLLSPLVAVVVLDVSVLIIRRQVSRRRMKQARLNDSVL